MTVSNSSFSFSTVAGENTVAILAKHEGLDKMYNVTGSTGTGQYAGIWGGVTNGGSALGVVVEVPRRPRRHGRNRGGRAGEELDDLPRRCLGRHPGHQELAGFLARRASRARCKDGVFATVGLRTSGLSSGSAWVNGHNLGRFSGNTLLYVPECWLGADNTVVIYDASGNSPTGVKLEYIETRARSSGTTVPGGTGGASGSGGRSGSGGAPGSGGTTGTAGSGGAGGSGGRLGSGGSAGGSGTGGTRASGGASGQGGTAAGGSPGSGGTTTGGRGGTTTSGSGGSGGFGGFGSGGTSAAGAGGQATTAMGGGGSSSGQGGRGSGAGGEPSGCACALGGRTSGTAVWVVFAVALIFRRRLRR